MKGKPRLLDTFCKAGGTSVGYFRAGFDVEGVDIDPQPHYPFKLYVGDAIEFILTHGHKYDVVAASPPCQVYSALAHLAGKQHRGLIPATRRALQETGKPYVIENVPGAPLINPIMLCGTSFGLQTTCGAQLRRHRLFETSPNILLTPPCQHIKGCRTIGIFGDKARDTGAEKRHYSKPKETRGPPPSTILFTLGDAKDAMGIDWMTFVELSQAIPPAYTEWIGRRLTERLDL